MDEIRLSNIEHSLRRIEDALVGSIGDNPTVGLIEKQRNQERDLAELKQFRLAVEPQVKEALAFKSEMKKLVAGIAVIIPLGFEVIKLAAEFIWEIFKGHGAK